MELLLQYVLLFLLSALLLGRLAFWHTLKRRLLGRAGSPAAVPALQPVPVRRAGSAK